MLGNFAPDEIQRETMEATTEIVAAIARASAVPSISAGRQDQRRTSDWMLIPVRKLYPLLAAQELIDAVTVIKTTTHLEPLCHHAIPLCCAIIDRSF